MNVGLFVARRLIDRGVVVRIAVATTATSLAVMIVALAVMAGFRAEITAGITAFTGHIDIRATDYASPSDRPPISLSDDLVRRVAALPGVRSVVPYVVETGIVKTAEATRGVMLTGVSESYDLGFFERCLTSGLLPRISSDSVRHNDILLSEGVARTLRLSVGDRVEMVFVSGDRPRRDRFRVCGLFSSGFGEMDDRFALTDIAAVRRIGGVGADSASGYRVDASLELADLPALAARVSDLVSSSVSRPVTVASVVDDYPRHFDWLATHDVNAAVIVAIMMTVALVSMISALLVILLERIRMIGILKTLGMTSAVLRRVFVFRAAHIVFRGLLWGNVVGLGVAFAQARWGFLRLDGEGYFVSRVPIVVEWWWVVALSVGAFVVLVSLMIFPTALVSRVMPEKTVRYQ